MAMEKINSEELNGKQARIPLTDDEMEQVTGGIDDSKCVILTSLEGVHASDTQGHFQYNGIIYQCTGMKCSDSQGRKCQMFVAEGGGSMILLPQ